MPSFRRRNTRRARELRNNATPAERLLWTQLQGRKLGHKFSRQIETGPFYPDFICRSLKFIVEIDGFSHDLTVEEDDERTRWLESEGYTVVRFTNDDVLTNLEGVVAAIAIALKDLPTPGPSRKREGR